MGGDDVDMISDAWEVVSLAPSKYYSCEIQTGIGSSRKILFDGLASDLLCFVFNDHVIVICFPGAENTIRRTPGCLVNIPAALKEVWDVVARAHRSMERARHGHDTSTDCVCLVRPSTLVDLVLMHRQFLSFLFNRRDTRLDKFMADLGVVESIYDNSSRERFLLENFYEAVRIENIPGLKI